MLSANQQPASLKAVAACDWPRLCTSHNNNLLLQLFHIIYIVTFVRLLVSVELWKSAAMAPKAEKKPAKKVAKKVAGGKGKKGKSKVESFKIYIYKVLKQVRLLYSSFLPWQVSLRSTMLTLSVYSNVSSPPKRQC